MSAIPRLRSAFFTGLVLVLIGVVLALPGIWLVVLGGSWYYLVAGLAFVLTGVLLIQYGPVALWTYALLVVGTLAWALWEAGLDWWPLAARGGVPFLIGLFLLTPMLGRACHPCGTATPFPGFPRCRG